MKFRDLFQDVEDWFWKLEYNPDSFFYELYLGIPNDWVYSEKNGLIDIELIHQLEENSIVKISTTDDTVTIDDILDTAKALISKNQELEKRKQLHREEMENLKNMLIAKEKNFLEYIDTVKDNTVKNGEVATEIVINENPVMGKSTGDDGSTEGAIDGVKNDFLTDIEKTTSK